MLTGDIRTLDLAKHRFEIGGLAYAQRPQEPFRHLEYPSNYAQALYPLTETGYATLNACKCFEQWRRYNYG